MSTILSWVVSIVIGWSLLSIFYWCFARIILHDLILFRIFQLRDNLRSAAIDNKAYIGSFQYEFLERRLCGALYTAPQITICNFIKFCLSDDANKPVPPEFIRFYKEASDPLKILWTNAIESVQVMMLVNSPIITSLLIPVVLIYILYKKFRQIVSDILSEKLEMFFETEILAPNLEFVYETPS